MLAIAAEYGHRDLCELARQWGARNYEQMLDVAEKGNHPELIVFAQQWIDAQPRRRPRRY